LQPLGEARRTTRYDRAHHRLHQRRREAQYRVRGADPAGTPIPRLYEAGELGSMVSYLYQNGSYLTEAMISGPAAGTNAVRLQTWRASEAA
jgi:predicted oxidoreductase